MTEAPVHKSVDGYVQPVVPGHYLMHWGDPADDKAGDHYDTCQVQEIR